MSALRLGYTRRDLATIPYGEIIFDLAAMSDGATAGQGHDVAVADATQDDIRTMLG